MGVCHNWTPRLPVVGTRGRMLSLWIPFGILCMQAVPFGVSTTAKMRSAYCRKNTLDEFVPNIWFANAFFMFGAHGHPSTQRWCRPLATPATPQVANVLVSRSNGRTSGETGAKHRNFWSPTLKHRNFFRFSSFFCYCVDLFGLGVGGWGSSIVDHARPTHPNPIQPAPTHPHPRYCKRFHAHRWKSFQRDI